MSTAKTEFFKVKASRLVRGTYRDIKKKLNGKNTTAAEELFGSEEIRPEREISRSKKIKSTAIVFAAGTAMGVSHVAAISSKYNITTSPRSTMCIGVAIGASTAGVWYKYIDAAEEDVNEEDIEMMFEMMSSTGFGDLDKEEFNKEHGKALDILHVMVTGQDSAEEEDTDRFQYEEDEDDSKVSEDNVFGKAPNLSNDRGGSPSNAFNKGNRFDPDKAERSVGISRPLRSSGRSSFLPDLDREEAEEKTGQPKEGWLDFG